MVHLHFFQDALVPDAPPLALPACNRVIYLAQGTVTTEAGESVGADDARHSAAALTLAPGPDGAAIWRWELTQEAAAAGARLSRPLATAPDPPWLMRCDAVSFPPGGCAYTHVHRGPGIRCIAEGSIEIECAGTRTRHGPGEPWFESGPEPVFAAADARVPTRFVRVMILPAALKGQRSITYVRAEDQDKPKPQTYVMHIDEPISVS